MLLMNSSSEASLDFDRNVTPSVHTDKSGSECDSIHNILVVVVHLILVVGVLLTLTPIHTVPKVTDKCRSK